MEDKNVWTYDIETLSNIFTYTGENTVTKEIVQYVIWSGRNDFYDFLVHLSQCKGQISFNGINFDYPVLHYIIKNRDSLIKLNGDQIAKKIYKEAQKTIEKEYSSVREEDVIIPQLDLFKLWHFDSKARITGLKKLEIAMEFDNVQEMPIHHTEKVTTNEQIEEILAYNLNDVKATHKFYTNSLDKIELRKDLTRKYGINFLNYSNSKMGEQLLLHLYCEATGKDKEYVKKQRTRRNSFKFSECIPSYVKFTTPEFNDLLEYLKGIEVPVLKDSFHYEFEFQNSNIVLGTGGIHFCIKSGVYKPKNGFLLKDSDVSSLYPSLGIANYLYPAHLGQEFYTVYKDGWHLDKDIICPDCKIYSPETCSIVPGEINTMILQSNSIRGGFPIGVTKRKDNGKYRAGLKKNNKRINIGTFKTPEEAFAAYKTEKENYVKEIAELWKDKIDSRVYEALINYTVNITD